MLAEIYKHTKQNTDLKAQMDDKMDKLTVELTAQIAALTAEVQKMRGDVRQALTATVRGTGSNSHGATGSNSAPAQQSASPAQHSASSASAAAGPAGATPGLFTFPTRLPDQSRHQIDCKGCDRKIQCCYAEVSNGFVNCLKINEHHYTGKKTVYCRWCARTETGYDPQKPNTADDYTSPCLCLQHMRTHNVWYDFR